MCSYLLPSEAYRAFGFTSAEPDDGDNPGEFSHDAGEAGHKITLMLDKRRVLAANYAFYAAYRFADLQAMDTLWSKTRTVAAIRSEGAEVFGREAVMEFWRRQLKEGIPPDIRPREPIVIGSEKAAMVVCIEDHDGSRMLATNVFVKDRYDWQITHHQSGELSFATGSD